ncbi:MAG: hypothetical protein PUI05_02735 [Peptoniphilaceae bacterium]|nr:hypothetical protein [Peptoniphilaceae bacterium]
MNEINEIKFEEIEIENSLEKELNELETELSSCGLACGGTKDEED